MKIQTFVIFVKRNLNINMLQIKCIVEYRCAAHSTCNLKYSVTKEISTVLHSGPNYDYHFVTNELKI